MKKISRYGSILTLSQSFLQFNISGLEAVQRSDKVYLENYTSMLSCTKERLVSP